MWIASKYGFFSIVKKDGGWHIRARNAEDLELLKNELSLPKITHTPEADYCARIFVADDTTGKDTMAKLMSALGESVDYPNFKNAIAASTAQRDKLHSYHDVWSVMHDYQIRSIK